MAATSMTATGYAYGYKNAQDGLMLMQFSGTYGSCVGKFEGCLERNPTSSSNWFPVAAIRYDNGAMVNGSITLTDDAERAYSIPAAGLTAVRFNLTSYGSGTLVVTPNSMPYNGQPFVAVQSSGETVTGLQTFSGGLSLTDNSLVKFGDGNDITIGWDNTDLDILQATANSSIKLGVSGAGIDVVMYGDTAGYNMTWDQSADALLFQDNAKIALGDDSDIVLKWDNTSLKVTQATPNSAVAWGVDGAGIDHIFFGDTASAAATWDQSDDSLILSGVAKIKHQTIAAATGTAIPVTHSGSFPITQNGAETNTLAIPTYLGQTLSIFVDTDTSGARVITSAQRINQAGNTIITLTEVGDFIKLEAITIAGALRWQVVSNDGAALS